MKFIQPVWSGPEIDGVTYSLLSRFLTCRERFRLLVVRGLKPLDRFNHKTAYGEMWHICEEVLASQGEIDGNLATSQPWVPRLTQYCQGLYLRYPYDQTAIHHWRNVCMTQFPLYVCFWHQHPDVISRKPLVQEQIFNVPYQLLSGRIVRLRGKWDSVDAIGDAVYLQENKTKGQIQPALIRRQLSFDLQTMLYLTALDNWTLEGTDLPGPIAGVRYNVVRRPLSGGKGTISKHKPTKSNPAGESDQEFYGRLRQVITESPEDYFMRWKVEIISSDLQRFQSQCLNPILEQLCDWWSWCSDSPNLGRPIRSSIHWRHPYGVYNILDEGGSTDLDEYLTSGSEVGLQHVDNLFPELTPN